jgi:hypothetical protein
MMTKVTRTAMIRIMDPELQGTIEGGVASLLRVAHHIAVCSELTSSSQKTSTKLATISV